MRVGKAIVPTSFYSGGYGRHRELEEFFAQAVSGGTGVNGLIARALSFRATRLGQAAEHHPQYDPTSKVLHYKTVIQPVSPE